MRAVDTLGVLVADAAARGYSALAESVEGVARVVEVGDPVMLAKVHDAWARNVQRDRGLLRRLGSADPHTEECAFPTAISVRVIDAVGVSLEELAARVSDRARQDPDQDP